MDSKFELQFNQFLDAFGCFASGKDDSYVKEIKVKNLEKFKSLLSPDGYIDRGKEIAYLNEYTPGEVIIKEF